MSASTRKGIVFGLLVGAVALGWFAKPWERRVRSGVSPAVTSGLATETVDSAGRIGDTGTAVVGVPPVIFATTWPRDPFWRGQSDADLAEAIDAPAETVESVLELQGIMMVGGERACVVNAQLVRLGDMVDGWTVVGIGEVDAQLTRTGQTLRLRLP